jgi:hypothetical protein
MSWSFTVNHIMQEFELDDTLLASMEALHPEYPHDMKLTLGLAKMAGLRSGTLAGGRTSSPYGGPEVILLTVTGTAEPADWHDTMKANIAAGPDEP